MVVISFANSVNLQLKRLKRREEDKRGGDGRGGLKGREEKEGLKGRKGKGTEEKREGLKRKEED